MLRLQHISLFQFKNYTNKSFEFKERIAGICGKNGMGKTNLLDAIHYLCFTRSYFTRQDATNVKHGYAGFRIEAGIKFGDNKESATCILRENGKKEFAINNDQYEKFSQHIGRYPCVIIAPDDAALITGDSRERRSFIDALISQIDQHYLQQLILYTKILQQRNSLLKNFAETNTKNYSLLDVFDDQLIKSGEYIFLKRKDFLVSFLPAVKHLYQSIASQPEDVTIIYDSELLLDSFKELLKANRQKDCLVQRTTAGIHKDDLEIFLNDNIFKNIASQGQRKSLLFALKLAEMDVLKKEKGFAPFLLLDDVFEKLDEERISNLLRKVCIDNDGQVFITDTNETRLVQHLNSIKCDYEIKTIS